jgi:flagellar protein FlbD
MPISKSRRTHGRVLANTWMDPLILLRRLGGPVFTLNPDLIERAEATPDTVVTLIGGNKYVIRESLDELVELIRDYRARIIASAEALTCDSDLYPDTGPAHSSGQARVRVLSTAVSPGQPPVVPIRRVDS